MLCTLIGAIMLSINIQVGLNMHLYDDIGDASSSLRGSTSSLTSILLEKKFYYSTFWCPWCLNDLLFQTRDLCLLCRPRGLGSAALNMCCVAQGAAEAYYEIGVHAWDMAAGRVIVEEAGGVVLDMTGERAIQC